MGAASSGRSCETVLVRDRLPHCGIADNEYMALAKCWIDVTEDSIVGTNQPKHGFWERIAKKYNKIKPAWAYKRNREQMRKTWDRMQPQLNAFIDVYKKAKEARASGESMEDVLQNALTTYKSIHGQFKFYNIWLMLMDKPKFDDGFPIAKKKTTADGAYTSSSGDAGGSERGTVREFRYTNLTSASRWPQDRRSPVEKKERSALPIRSRPRTPTMTTTYP